MGFPPAHTIVCLFGTMTTIRSYSRVTKRGFPSQLQASHSVWEMKNVCSSFIARFSSNHRFGGLFACTSRDGDGAAGCLTGPVRYAGLQRHSAEWNTITGRGTQRSAAEKRVIPTAGLLKGKEPFSQPKHPEPPPNSSP